MKEIINSTLGQIEFIVSLLSIAVVIYGALRAVASFIKTEVHHARDENKIHMLMSIRADLGVYLLLGLELLISADIITTILNPRLMELAELAGIVVLRTVLSLFLNKELKELQ
jgi:Predicted membrane protein